MDITATDGVGINTAAESGVDLKVNGQLIKLGALTVATGGKNTNIANCKKLMIMQCGSILLMDR